MTTIAGTQRTIRQGEWFLGNTKCRKLVFLYFSIKIKQICFKVCSKLSIFLLEYFVVVWKDPEFYYYYFFFFENNTIRSCNNVSKISANF